MSRRLEEYGAVLRRQQSEQQTELPQCIEEKRDVLNTAYLPSDQTDHRTSDIAQEATPGYTAIPVQNVDDVVQQISASQHRPPQPYRK